MKKDSERQPILLTIFYDIITIKVIWFPIITVPRFLAKILHILNMKIIRIKCMNVLYKFQVPNHK